jgi:hypothetical protein
VIDVLQETCMDFWRMVVEHNVATMVVLSSEGEFWQYWPLDQGDKVGHSWKKCDIFWIKNFNLPYLTLGARKDVQATGEAFSPQERTSRTSKHEIS